MSAVRSSRHRGVLTDSGPGIGRGLLPSVLLHLPILALLAVGQWSKPPPPIDRDAFMVTAVVLPKSAGLPTKAAAPKPSPAGEAAPKAKKEAPAPLKDEVILKTPDAPKPEGPEKEPDKKPDKEPPRKPNLKDLVANVEETSDTLVFETSPEGDPNAKPEDGLRAQFGRALSPFERRVRDAVQYNWFPKASRSPVPDELWAAVSFTIDDQGTIQGPAVAASSGDFVYDQSCLRAVMRTGRVPAPGPTDKRNVAVGFSPKDKQ